MTFDELVFNPREFLNGVQATHTFPNGYGVSVIKGSDTYGGPHLYELAIIRDNKLCYDTPITNDVIGWLTPEDVTKYLKEVEAL